jgi:exosortase A
VSEAAILARPASAWQRHLPATALTVAGLLLLFGRDAADMATIWWSSSTYEHCLLILPLIGWLVWQRRAVLAGIEPKGWAPPLLWAAAGALGWLVGEAGDVALPRDLGLVMMVQGAVAAMLGRGAAAALLFPLFYLVALVPAGDFIVPPLQTVTARICMVLLHLFRVPATIDGVFITTPAGWFKVAEACSGAKFLIAMIALGMLVAHVGFRSWPRRILFLLACIVMPVLANGVRAFGTIYVAGFVGVGAAGGFDHIVYGWFFFAAVIAALMAAAWRFFDRPADAPPVDPQAVARQAALQRRETGLPILLAAILAIALAPVAWSRIAVASGTAPIAAAAHLPEVPGWSRVPATGGTPWRPRFDGADRLLLQRYRDAQGREVDLAVALYAAQAHGRALVGYGHGAVDPDGPWAWASDRPAPENAKAEHITAPAVSREVVSFYRVGGMQTGSPARVKIETLRHHLLGGHQSAAALLVSAEDGRGGRPAVDAFLAALGPAGPMLDRIAEGR